MRKRLQRGATTVEMTLVGIPLMFVLISTFEMSRGMWMYHTLAFAVREGVRYASVHGGDCTGPPFNNSCTVTQAQIASIIEKASVGVDSANTQLRFCTPACTSASAWTCNFTPPNNNNCGPTVWPPTGSNAAGTTIEIDMRTPFTSMIAMFWPGAGHTVTFSTVNFVAGSTDTIKF